MVNTIASILHEAFSDQVTGKDLSVGAMTVRTIFIFVVWLVIVRFADRRMLGKYSAFDTVLAVMIGAVLGRTINGGASLWGSLAAVVALVVVHWALALLTHRWHAFGKLVKGEALELVSDGKIDGKAMRASLITENDLEEMLRLHGRIGKPSEAKLAVLERNGQISSIPFER